MDSETFDQKYDRLMTFASENLGGHITGGIVARLRKPWLIEDYLEDASKDTALADMTSLASQVNNVDGATFDRDARLRSREFGKILTVREWWHDLVGECGGAIGFKAAYIAHLDRTSYLF